MLDMTDEAAAGRDRTAAYAPISDYAIIGDCRTAALVSRTGSIDWLCTPHFAGPSVFAALLDTARGGHFAIRPRPRFTSTRRYWPGTNVLETVFTTDRGSVRLIDCMPIADENDYRVRLQPLRETLRVVEGLAGEVELEAIYAPRPDYARAKAPLTHRGALGWSCSVGSRLWLLHTDAAVTPSAAATELVGRFRLKPGERRRFSLTYTERDIATVAPLGPHADARLEATRRWWEAWHARCTYDGPYRDAVVRSALALKLLSYSLSGAIIAAPTTSLPEAVGGVRNWDYRYCWLRDAALTARVLLNVGLRAEGDSFLGWLLHATRPTWPQLCVLYDIYGEHAVAERTLAHLEGYRGSRPVRVGNGANRQHQWDVYGEVVQAAYEYVCHGGVLQRDECRLLIGLGRAVCSVWDQPDNGIWEVRGQLRHYTYSKFMCWLALDRLVRLSKRGVLPVPAHFEQVRRAIGETLEARGYSERHQSYTAVLDGDEVDVSLLLMAVYGYGKATDARLQNTCRRIERELARDELVYRYRPTVDGLPGHEGTFTIGSFWMVDYLARAGRHDDAVARFEALLARANDVGLYSEQFDADTGAALGNFPQGFSHVGLIAAALTLENTRRRR